METALLKRLVTLVFSGIVNIISRATLLQLVSNSLPAGTGIGGTLPQLNVAPSAQEGTRILTFFISLEQDPVIVTNV